MNVDVKRRKSVLIHANLQPSACLVTQHKFAQ